jgi:FkbM family methyltransferase
VKSVLKRLVYTLPEHWVVLLKSLYFRRQMKQAAFNPDEVEADLVPSMVQPGDWVLDIGANIGHYTLLFSRCVGPTGRVLAFEPIPATFAALAMNALHAPFPNVSLFNVAVSEQTQRVAMTMPPLGNTGQGNPYEAHITDDGEFSILCLPIDGLGIRQRVTLVKIDAEGHELQVLHGMKGLLERDHPRLIVEGDDAEVEQFLGSLGYGFTKQPGAWNRVYAPLRNNAT